MARLDNRTNVRGNTQEGIEKVCSNCFEFTRKCRGKVAADDSCDRFVSPPLPTSLAQPDPAILADLMREVGEDFVFDR